MLTLPWAVICAEDAARLSAALVQQGPLGAGRTTVLTWLISAADSSKQVATTRAKAIKALGLVAETDPRLLASSTVQKGVNKALQVCSHTSKQDLSQLVNCVVSLHANSLGNQCRVTLYCTRAGCALQGSCHCQVASLQLNFATCPCLHCFCVWCILLCSEALMTS